MNTLIVTGTGTEIGKTVVTAGIAALAVAAGRRVAVLKPAQTGVAANEPGDADEIARLVPGITKVEIVRYPEPLAPRTAARRSGIPPVSMTTILDTIATLQATHDLVLVEGAGGLLVQFDEEGNTLADVAQRSGAEVLMVVAPGLGTLNVTALTAEALRNRECSCVGLVIGRWPAEPDLAERCNLQDLPEVAGVPLLGVVPDNFNADVSTFAESMRPHLASILFGDFNPAAMRH
jgi:dethiobiotin synthetase